MPWEETDEYVRSEHENPENYDKKFDADNQYRYCQGIKTIVGCPQGHYKNVKCAVGMQVQSYLFIKGKGRGMAKATLNL
jgi:hypothetical protein